MKDVLALTFDFFNTLVFHREGRGRGRVLMEYLRAQGWEPAPWRHEILYEIFEIHDREYSPSAAADEKRAYRVRLASRVFDRVAVHVSPADAAAHADALWAMLGPGCLELFPEVAETLADLRGRGLRLGLISNWQSGLRHFCAELGLAEHFDCILSSADVGVAKPDPRIFLEAAQRLGVSPNRVLHVGDTYADDYAGGIDAGFHTVMIDRTGKPREAEPRTIGRLSEVFDLLTDA